MDRVELIAQVIGPSTLEDDRLACKEIRDRVSDSRVVVVDSESDGWSPRDLASYFSTLTFVVAVRLHGAILAMTAGTPAFAISYFTGKTQGVLTSVGMPDSWCHLEDFRPERVVEWLSVEAPQMRMARLRREVSSARTLLHGSGYGEAS